MTGRRATPGPGERSGVSAVWQMSWWVAIWRGRANVNAPSKAAACPAGTAKGGAAPHWIRLGRRRTPQAPASTCDARFCSPPLALSARHPIARSTLQFNFDFFPDLLWPLDHTHSVLASHPAPMSLKYARMEEYELTRETSHEPHEISESPNEDGAESQLLPQPAHPPATSRSLNSILRALVPSTWSRRRPGHLPRTKRPHRTLLRACFRGSAFRKLLRFFYAFLLVLFSTIVVGAVFYPSYTRLPRHYQELRNQVNSSSQPGRGNPREEKVFIAASIRDLDGRLAKGIWAEKILELVELLGPDNVFLSIYENDAGAVGQAALQELDEKLEFPHLLKFEEHLPIDVFPTVIVPDGTRRVKRIAYLAEVRNRALRPLETSEVRYDKLLYLNDVVFNPVDVLHLLFSTRMAETGQTDYRAACAVDFINPFKFYDNFATRDSEGYSMGIPFFPWFTASGEAQSLQDVLDGKDAVRVRSCWGGMVAFDAKFFQKALSDDQEPVTALGEFRNISAPYRFRAEEDLFWDASECCLIHADIQNPYSHESGIYVNPFVRVAYETRTLSWLGFTRRFERLYSPIHFLLSSMTGMPWYNPRRAEHAGEEVEETVWVPDQSLAAGGSFQALPRIATNSGFCGRRGLQIMKMDTGSAGHNWEGIPPPS
jgi:Cryptococcal mannosyltransferase 1